MAYAKTDWVNGTTPLSAENLDHIEEGIYQNSSSLAEKAYYFNTVADMVTSNKIKDGDYIITLGYHTINDGGGGDYRIKQTSSNYSILLSNGLYAELIVSTELNVLKIGVDKTGIVDCLNIVQNAINSLLFKKIYFPNGKYLFSNSIIINASTPNGLEICGDGNYGSSVALGTTLTTSGDMFTFYNANQGISIHHFNIDCNGTAFNFIDPALNSRITDSHIHNINIVKCNTMVSIDCATGYNYFENFTVSVFTRGFVIGEHYSNSNPTYPAPNYIYIKNVQIGSGTPIELFNTSYVFVENCDFYTCNVGIVIHDKCFNLSVTNNVFFNCAIDFKFDAVANVTAYHKIIGNFFYKKAGSYIIYSNCTAFYVQDVLFSCNSIRNDGATAYMLINKPFYWVFKTNSYPTGTNATFFDIQNYGTGSIFEDFDENGMETALANTGSTSVTITMRGMLPAINYLKNIILESPGVNYYVSNLTPTTITITFVNDTVYPTVKAYIHK